MKNKNLNKYTLFLNKMDIIKAIKKYEKEFRIENYELYETNKIEFLKKLDEFIGQKMVEIRKDEGK